MTIEKKSKKKEKIIIGSIERCGLPELGISDLQIKVDTGAKTSSLHVDHVELFEENGEAWISFDIHPDLFNVDTLVTCRSKVKDTRNVKSSNGTTEHRYVIDTVIQFSEESWPIELTLTDRSDMSYMMLLGRQGMGTRVLVDPSKKFLAT